MRTLSSQLRFWGIIVFFLLTGLFAYFQMRDIWNGVAITVDNLKPYTIVSEAPLLITGSAKHATRLTINDRRIFITEEGRFTDQLLILPGYSILTIRAEDKFGNIRVKTFELYNTEERPAFEAPVKEDPPQEESISSE